MRPLGESSFAIDLGAMAGPIQAYAGISTNQQLPERHMSSRACVEIANTLRRMVESFADQSVAARLQVLADSYEHRARAYAVSRESRRRRAGDAHLGGEHEV